MCDRFGDRCGANNAANAACVTATEATKGKTGQAAGMFTSSSRPDVPSTSLGSVYSLPPFLFQRDAGLTRRLPSPNFLPAVKHPLTSYRASTVATAWNNALGLTNVPNLTGA